MTVREHSTLGDEEGGQEFTSADEEVLVLFAAQSGDGARQRTHQDERRARADPGGADRDLAGGRSDLQDRWAGRFLDRWCTRTMRSRLDPMKDVARMVRSHRDLILNWFRAKGQFSSGIVEGFNGKARVITKRAYGFRTCEAMEVTLYHTLGNLPEPAATPQPLPEVALSPHPDDGAHPRDESIRRHHLRLVRYVAKGCCEGSSRRAGLRWDVEKRACKAA